MPELTGHIDNLMMRSTEKLANQHFRFTLLFGQGPVQERERIPTTGRHGLNLYSRLLGMAAGEMLNDGITDTVIISGGQTGARAGTPEAKTEAGLIADVVRRRIVRTSRDGQFIFVGHNEKVLRVEADGRPREGALVDKEVQQIVDKHIRIEDKATDTLENIGFILNTHLANVPDTENIAFLGIGFHAHDTWSGAGVGRLEKLAKILGIPVTTYSAEGILNKLSSARRPYEQGGQLLTRVPRKSPKGRSELIRLTNMSLEHPVSQLKSKQERLLVEGLEKGSWKPLVGLLRDQRRIRQMIHQDSYILGLLGKKVKQPEEYVLTAPIEEVVKTVQSLPVKGVSSSYSRVKTTVFDKLRALSDQTGIDYFGKYAKGTIPPEQ